MRELLISLYAKLTDRLDGLINDRIAKKVHPIIRTEEELIREIQTNGCSMARFGDGEFSLIQGNDLKFQKYDRRLANELHEILIEKKSKLMVCIPDVFEGLDQYTERARLYWSKYLHSNRFRIYKMLDMNRVYYDTQITRFYIDYTNKDKSIDKIVRLKDIWHKKEILLVEGAKSRLGMNNDLFAGANRVRRIICPAVNAYDRIDEIESAVIKSAENDELILLALGPTATVLASRLCSRGYQALDIGNIDIEYEWFLEGAKEKKPVPNKYIGEMPGGDCVSDDLTDLYKSQIITVI